MKQKVHFLVISGFVCVITSFILYQRGLINGYKKGYKNASEVFTRTKSEMTK